MEDLGGGRSRDARGFRTTPLLFLVAAMVLLVVVELFAHARTLTEADSINLARAMDNFDVTRDQPHSPGYPLVVTTARLVPWGDALQRYLTTALIFSLAGLLATFWLARQMFDDRAAAIAVCLVVAAPPFLYYSNVVSVYPPELAFAPLIVLACSWVARKPTLTNTVSLFALTALAGGFRPTMLGLMAPAVALALWFGRPPIKAVALGVASAVVVIAAWAVPMIGESDGLSAYLAQNRTQWSTSAAGTSIFYGASLRENAFNVYIALLGTFAALLPGLLLLPFVKKRDGAPRHRREWSLLAAWVLPYMAFYFIFHYGKPGYALATLPALAIGVAALVSSHPRALTAAATVAALGIAAFVWLPHLHLPGRAAAFLATSDSIEVQDEEALGLQEIARTCHPPDCEIASLEGSHDFYYHEPKALERWYGLGARVISVNEGQPELLSGSVYWIGSVVPEDVAQMAEPRDDIGSWHVYWSDPVTTAVIVKRLVG